MNNVIKLFKIYYQNIRKYLANQILVLFKDYPLISVLRLINSSEKFNWDSTNVANKMSGFEDLSFLFWNCPLNRGIIRMDFDEAGFLFKIIKSIEKPKGVEIGRFKGGGTFLLAVAVGDNGKLLSIDISPKNDEILRETLGRYGLIDRVELIIGDSRNVIRNDLYDFVFIDGDHSYEGAKQDHNKWGKLVKAGGYIIHHDMANAREYSTQENDLAKLRVDILKIQRNEIKILKEIGSLTIFIREFDSWTDI